jgi:hypothetical protein
VDLPRCQYRVQTSQNSEGEISARIGGVKRQESGGPKEAELAPFQTPDRRVWSLWTRENDIARA